MSNPSPAFIQAADLWADVLAVRQRSPLVHSVTNLVVSNFNANMLLALGASPLMAHAHEEVQDMARLAQAVVLNIGTLDPYWVQSMGLALAAAVAAGRPTVLDPVGAGASAYRNQTLLRLLAGRPSVMRGNGSEILAVAGSAGAGKGVDSTASSDAAVSAAQALAQGHGMVVVVSGQHDHVLAPDGRHAVLSNGHPLMTRVTGVGCSASALVGAFAAVQPDPWRASVAAMAYLGVAGEWAAERVAQQQGGVGSYQIALLDAVDQLDEAGFVGRLRLAQPGGVRAD